jgi:hypothetical protein
MDLFKKDIDDILKYIENAKAVGQSDCVYKTDKIQGNIYKILNILKAELPNHKIWYVDPILIRAPFEVVEEWGIHIQWLDEINPNTV